MAVCEESSSRESDLVRVLSLIEVSVVLNRARLVARGHIAMMLARVCWFSTIKPGRNAKGEPFKSRIFLTNFFDLNPSKVITRFVVIVISYILLASQLSYAMLLTMKNMRRMGCCKSMGLSSW